MIHNTRGQDRLLAAVQSARVPQSALTQNLHDLFGNDQLFLCGAQAGMLYLDNHVFHNTWLSDRIMTDESSKPAVHFHPSPRHPHTRLACIS